MASQFAESLVEEALAGLAAAQAREVAARTDQLLEDPDLAAGDRGTLLTARAIAGQHFEPPTESYQRFLEALPLLEEAGEFDRHLSALGSAASFALMLGNLQECMELAVSALTIAGSTRIEAVPTNVQANLGVLFNEFSAFDLAFELSGEAFGSFDGDTADGLALLTGFSYARTIIDAAWHGDSTSDDRLAIAQETAQRILDGGSAQDSDSGRARTLIGQVLLSEVALLRSDTETAKAHIDTALKVPQGSQALFEGYLRLVAGMVARRQGRAHDAIALLDAAEEAVAHEVHRMDRLRAERAAAYAMLGNFEAAYDEALLRAETSTRHNVHYMGAVIGQIRARAKAEQSRLTLVETTETLTERTRTDALTGVAARGWFDICLDARVSDGGETAIILLDIDHFKSVNDRYSHQVGDEVLRRVGELLLKVCDADATVARYGGEEFVILPASGDLFAAEMLAEHVRNAIEAEPWHRIHAALEVTASVGVSSGPSTRAKDTLSSADTALYAAKRRGRNGVVAQPLRTRESDRPPL